MQILYKTFLLLHIRMYKMKFLKMCLRKWTFVVLSCFALSELLRAVYHINLKGALASLALTFFFMYLAIYWVKVWKKADYMISRAIHSPFPDEEEEEK